MSVSKSLGSIIDPRYREYVEATRLELETIFKRELDKRDIAIRNLRAALDQADINTRSAVAKEVDGALSRDRTRLTRMRVLKMLDDMGINE